MDNPNHKVHDANDAMRIIVQLRQAFIAAHGALALDGDIFICCACGEGAIEPAHQGVKHQVILGNACPACDATADCTAWKVFRIRAQQQDDRSGKVTN